MSESLPALVQEFEQAVSLPKREIHERILALEEQLLELPQMELPVKHHYSKGVYGRELSIPKDSVIVGKIHKYPVMNVISAGEVSVLSIDGFMRVKAPYTFVSSPGAKRVIFAHEDTVWSNFHGTDETDVEKIEEEFIAKTIEEVPMIAEEMKLFLTEAK